MEYIQIRGNQPLQGTITLHGAKNSVLPILAGAVLIDGTATIENCPRLSDVAVCSRILEHLGGAVTREGNVIAAEMQNVSRAEIPSTLMKEMRSSIVFLGSIAARCGYGTMCLPGGCQIGARPIDLHLLALRALGYTVEFDGDCITCRREKARGGRVLLPFPSVGATENALLASVLLPGSSVIENAAREPEIADLATFLNKAGARIRGAGTNRIEIDGVTKLHSVSHAVIPDRILAATIMAAVAAAGGDVSLSGVRLSHLQSVLHVFRQMGCCLQTDANLLSISRPDRTRAVSRITTGVYPAFPTDAQAPVMAALTLSRGISRIHETIFENRMRHVTPLCRFGADIRVNGACAEIRGVSALHATDVACTDLRGGAALIVAALAAEGTSCVRQIEHLDRGYEQIEHLFSSLGADMRRRNDEKG